MKRRLAIQVDPGSNPELIQKHLLLALAVAVIWEARKAVGLEEK